MDGSAYSLQSPGRPRRILARCFYLVAFTAFAWAVANIAVTTTNNSLANTLVAGVLLLCLCLLLRVATPRLDALSKKQETRIALMALGLYTLVQLVLAWFLLAIPISEFAIVLEAVHHLVETGTLGPFNGYFSTTPNNLGILMLLYLLYKPLSLLGITPGTIGIGVGDVLALHNAPTAALYAGALLGVASVVGGIYYIWRLAQLLFQKPSRSLLTLLLCLLFAPFLLWTTFFYTDTLSIFFPAAVLYQYLKSCGATGREKWLRLAATAILCFLGIKMKTTLLLLVPAICIHLLMCLPVKKNLGSGAAILGMLLLLHGGFELYIRNNSWYDYPPERVTSYASEWLMMGSHGDGDACQCEECNRVRTSGTPAQRNRLAWAWTLENYASYSPAQLVSFMTHKAVLTWGRGDYEALDYAMNARQDNAARIFLHPGGALRAPLQYYCSTYNLMLLAAFLASLFSGIRRGRFSSFSVVHLCLFGALLFFSVWETHARYLLNFTPLILLCAVQGIELLAARLPLAKRSTRTGAPAA